MAPLKKSLSLGAWSESDEGRSSDAWSDYQARPPAAAQEPLRPKTPEDQAAKEEPPSPKAKPRPKLAKPKMKLIWTEITPQEEVVIVPYLNDRKATLEERAQRLDERSQLVLRTNVDLEARIAEEDHSIADLRVELDCRQDEWSNLQSLMQERKDEHEEAQARLARLREQRVSEEKRLRERHLDLSERLGQLTNEWHRLIRSQAEEERKVQQNRVVFEDLRTQVRTLEQRKADLEFGDGSPGAAAAEAGDPSTASRLFDHVVSSGPARLPDAARKEPSIFGSSNNSDCDDRASCTYSTSNLGDAVPERAFGTFGDRPTFGEGDAIDEGAGSEIASPRRSTSQSPKPPDPSRRSTSQSPKPPPEPRVGVARPPLYRSASRGSQ